MDEISTIPETVFQEGVPNSPLKRAGLDLGRLIDGVSNEAYHSGPGISKSGLWTIYTKSPAHFAFPPVKEETTASKSIKDFGSACHIAVLEPNTFEARVVRGPADRRGNKWSDLVDFHKTTGKIVLVEADYDEIQIIRDTIHADAYINAIITGGKPQVEASGYWMNEHDMLCKFRPDFYREDIGIMIDFKTTSSARRDAFARSVIDYGYHVQEAFYSDGFTACNLPINGTLFLAAEKEAPYAFKLYELPPSIIDEARVIVDKAMATYVECRRTDMWPFYGDGVEELRFPRWAYKETRAPDTVTEEYA